MPRPARRRRSRSRACGSWLGRILHFRAHSERLEDSAEILRDRGEDPAAPAADRMGEGELRGGEREPMELVAFAVVTIDVTLSVVDVADERMAQVLHVTADLVKPTCLRDQLDQRTALD